MPRIKAGLYQLGSRRGSFKKRRRGKPNGPGTTLYEWFPTCLALSGHMGVPLEHTTMESQSPGEIKRREVSWTLRKKLAQKRSRGGRWCWARERHGFLLLQLFPNGGATDIVFVTLFCIVVGTAISWCGGRCAVPDGHYTAFN